MQDYSLERKIQLTCERIKAWYEWWDGQVYISFSGGKDSTVLLDLIRNECGYVDVPAVFIDTGLEYPEIREFVKTFDNVEWIKPEMNFKQVIKTYGYPMISKEVSKMVWEVKQALKKGKTAPTYRMEKFNGTAIDKRTGKLSQYNVPHYKFLLNDDAPMIGAKCCDVMKKDPAVKYSKETGRWAYTAMMAAESRMRRQKWIQNGCNAFYSKKPVSNPMAFWTEQDVLRYIKNRNLKICSVYGDIITDYSNTDEVAGQYEMSDCYGKEAEKFNAAPLPLKTTGCDRTGCMFCGYGCHLEEEGKGRFEMMKHTHPRQYDYIMKPIKDGGLGFKEVIDWINEKGNMHIRY